jgi:O-succinylbenzoic acid--CoA ligase
MRHDSGTRYHHPVPDVVGLALPGGPAWVDELKRAWDAGNAVAPIDLRLPPPARLEQLSTLAPTVIVDEHGRHPHEGRPAEPGDALVVSTSGTTGAPRAAVLTHDAVRASATATSAALAVDPGSDRWLACLPLAHAGGLGVVTRALSTETALEIHDGFDPAAVTAASQAGATLVSLVPAVVDRIDAAGFRRILLGGSAIPADRPANAVATYGMTETGGGVVYDGRPLAGVECREVDGELQLRCPMLLRAYRDGTDPRVADGWYPTGDAGTVVDGLVEVHGRLDDAIVTGGEKVWPARVERILESVPAVAAAAVVGRPDPEWGERVVAVIQPADPGKPPTLDALRDAVRGELPAWYVPRELVVVPELPLTTSGKTSRAALRLA